MSIETDLQKLRDEMGRLSRLADVEFVAEVRRSRADFIEWDLFVDRELRMRALLK